MKKYGDTPHLLTFGLTTYSSDTRYVKNKNPQYNIKNFLGIEMPLFRKKMLMLDEKLQRNASKFAIFYVYENPKLDFSFHTTLFFPS